MKCTEVRKLLPGLTLGDLDAEPARELRRHLEGCAGCRGEEESLAAAAAALRNVPPLAGSGDRRESVVAAMGRAHTEESEKRLIRPRRIGMKAFAAAGLLAVLGAGGIWFVGSAGVELSAVAVDGRVDVYHARKGVWSPLAAGDVVRPGDRLFTHATGTVRFETPGGRVHVEPKTWLSVTPKGRIVLESGRIRVEISGARAIDIADTAGNYVSVGEGRLEAEIREWRGVVLGASQKPGQPPVEPQDAKEERAFRLFARVTEGQALLHGSQQQKLLATAGQEGSFDGTGRPGLQPVPPAGPVSLPARFRLDLEKDERGETLRWRVEESEVRAPFAGGAAWLRISATDPEGIPVVAGESEIPLRVRVKIIR